MDLEELCVPQEWVDIPSFAADYYLAVQVNLEADEDERWMSVCGFATHRQLKNVGFLNWRDRTYVLPAENLTTNLMVMQVTLGLQMQSEIPALPRLSSPDAKKLLEILGDSSIYSPRLRVDVPFEQWAALLDNEEWRHQLYHRRIGRLAVAPHTTVVNNLNHWFQNIFEEGWQSVNAILNPESSKLATAFRQRKVASQGVDVERIKLIDLGMQLGNQSVALLVGLVREDEYNVSIRVQLHPACGQTYLPPNIRLALLSPKGATLQEFTSRSQDYFIQLKRFTCPTGKSFSIQAAINNFSITEDFIISPPTVDKYE